MELPDNLNIKTIFYQLLRLSCWQRCSCDIHGSAAVPISHNIHYCASSCAMILRVMFPLQLLGIPKHALAFHALPGQMFRSFNKNVKILLGSPRTTLQHHQGTAKRTAKALASTARSSTGVARAIDSTGTIESSNAFFLENDGRWIDYQETFASNNEVKEQDDSDFLRELTVTHLRQEARQRGQTSTGSREALVERMLSKQSPGKTLSYSNTESNAISSGWRVARITYR